MAKRVMEPKPRRGHVAPATGHIKVQFNIRPEINRMIDLGAAKEETTRSQYIENLVEAAAIWSFCKKSANSVSRTFFVGIRKSVASMRNMNKTARVAESGSLRRRSR